MQITPLMQKPLRQKYINRYKLSYDNQVSIFQENLIDNSNVELFSTISLELLINIAPP